MSDRSFDLQGFPRDIHELLVLSALRPGPKHGYQIALDVETESGGLFRFKHGTLYPVLHRLEGRGLIRGTWSKERGRRKKVYSLTRSGVTHLAGGADRVQEVLSGLMALLRHPDGAAA